MTLLAPPDTTRLIWFAIAWALAALFHLAGNTRDAWNTDPVLAVISLLLGASAVAVLLAPHDRRFLVGLCAIVPLHAWQEAPFVGNHWVLAALLSSAIVLTGVRRKFIATARWQDFLPVARLTLLVAYGFAAFAKVNADFLNPAVSCAVYYHDQLVSSWGLSTLKISDSPLLGRSVAVLAMLTELTIAATLAVRRTRRTGLALAFSFHWLLAMDLNQHFWDFSSVLFAGFLLFLDDAQVTRLQEWTGRAARFAPRPALLRLLVILAGAAVAGLNVLPLPPQYGEALVQLGHWAWWVYGTVVALMVLALLPVPIQAEVNYGRHISAAMLIVPTLALLNGLTPYLEIKTGFGWNMYSNLRTVAGHTNHLLLPGTLDLTGAQRNLVRIVESSDAELSRLRAEQYALTYSEFREYAHRFPQGSVTYERDGVIHHVARLGDNQVGQEPIGVMARRLLSFRVVDLRRAERCQPTFSPAR